MGKVLKLHTNPPYDYGLTVGDELPVAFEDEESYYTYVMGGFPLSFSKEPDEDGLSYKTWFTVEESEE